MSTLLRNGSRIANANGELLPRSASLNTGSQPRESSRESVFTGPAAGSFDSLIRSIPTGAQPTVESFSRGGRDLQHQQPPAEPKVAPLNEAFLMSMYSKLPSTVLDVFYEDDQPARSPQRDASEKRGDRSAAPEERSAQSAAVKETDANAPAADEAPAVQETADPERDTAVAPALGDASPGAASPEALGGTKRSAAAVTGGADGAPTFAPHVFSNGSLKQPDFARTALQVATPAVVAAVRAPSECPALEPSDELVEALNYGQVDCGNNSTLELVFDPSDGAQSSAEALSQLAANNVVVHEQQHLDLQQVLNSLSSEQVAQPQASPEDALADVDADRAAICRQIAAIKAKVDESHAKLARITDFLLNWIADEHVTTKRVINLLSVKELLTVIERLLQKNDARINSIMAAIGEDAQPQSAELLL